jgi:uncharacterized protein YycO
MLIPALLILSIIFWIGSYKNFNDTVPRERMLFIRHMLNNIIFQGKGTGSYDGRVLNNDFSVLEPGDIILSTDPGGAYGYWTHAAMYLGNNEIAECLLTTGVTKRPVKECSYCTETSVIRVNADKAKIKSAVLFVEEQLGEPFFIFTDKNNKRVWYCTKLIWAAYKEQGIDLDPKGDWPLPDAFFDSQYVNLIYRNQE